MATETPIEKKIRQFKAEVGDRELTTEQAKIYAAFIPTERNKKNPKPACSVPFRGFHDKCAILVPSLRFRKLFDQPAANPKRTVAKSEKRCKSTQFIKTTT